MTSREVEITHESGLNQLLAAVGLECERTPVSSITSSSEGIIEEVGPAVEEEHPTQEVVEEENSVSEEILEELPEIFPTPSLRRLIPDKIRTYEEYNRIHVLPEEFKTYIDPEAIPRIAITPPKKYIEILADLLGCTMYKSSLPEYWFLDTMANLLRRAQDDNLHRPTQAILMLWFCEWMKEMQHFDAADRHRMLRRFKDNMLSAASYIAEEGTLPTPVDAGIYYKTQEQANITVSTAVNETHTKNQVTFEDTGYKCSLLDLTKIIHYIYDLTDYQYDLVRSVFTHTPDHILIDAPDQLQVPKKLYAKLKPLKKEVKKGEHSPKGKKKEPWTDYEDYIHLMQIKTKEEKALAEQEEEDREAWNRRSSILPLTFAGTDDFFNKYWPPPPPPPEPEKLPEPDPKKGKGKGKK